MYLTQGLQRSLQQTPDRIATVYRGRRRRFSALGRRVSRLAGALRALGLEPGERVAILARNSDRWLEAMMSIWWAGGALQALHVRWSIEQVLTAVAEGGPRVLFLGEHVLHFAEQLRAAAPALLLVHMGDGPTPEGLLSFEDLIETGEAIEDAGRGGNDLAAIIYTRGTTGAPKGVMQTHLNLWSSSAHRLTQVQHLVHESRVLHALPLSQPGALSRAVMQFMAGEAHVLIPAFDEIELLETVEREAVTELLLGAEPLVQLINHPFSPRHDLASLRCLIFGNGLLETAMLDRILQRLPNAEIHQGYSLTEASPSVAYHVLERHPGPDRAERGRWASVGRGGFGMSVKVVDAQGQELPRGEVGEVLVRGPSLMAGYWCRPEDSARVLRPDGWLHTGDRAHMDEEGYLFLAGRGKASKPAARVERRRKPRTAAEAPST